MNIHENGHVILICGGSCSGKSSSGIHLKKIIRPPQLFHFDFDEQLIAVCDSMFNGDIGASMLYILKQLPSVAEKRSFFMDHWMPPQYEIQVRKLLTNHKTFYVWLHCSDRCELDRRDKERQNNNDYRGEGVTEAGAGLETSLPYDCKIDTTKKSPKEVAALIHRKARRHWGYDA